MTGITRYTARLAVPVTVAAAVLSLPVLAPAPAAAAAPAATGCTRPVPFHADRFAHPTTIDNKWLPLVPGTRFVLTGSTDGSGGTRPHEVIFTVTSLTKVVDGVRTRVILDKDRQDGILQEAELAFFAQDDGGNVWSLGEYPEEYVDGVFDGAPNTWISGLAGARGGLMMLADPQLNGPRYVQGSAPDIDFLDCAQVFARDQQVCVPVACYSKVLVTDENSPLDPAGGHQRKFYAPGVGNVQITAVDDPEAETLQLTSLVTLGPVALAEANAAALVLDVHGHLVSPVYARTPLVRFP